MAAVRQGKKTEHGPIPKLAGSGRRRLDRQGERRFAALKQWRGEKSIELAIDPGVLCPNSALEAIACSNPTTKVEIQSMPGLKSWFAREFGGEIVKINRETNVPQSES